MVPSYRVKKKPQRRREEERKNAMHEQSIETDANSTRYRRDFEAQVKKICEQTTKSSMKGTLVKTPSKAGEPAPAANCETATALPRTTASTQL